MTRRTSNYVRFDGRQTPVGSPVWTRSYLANYNGFGADAVTPGAAAAPPIFDQIKGMLAPAAQAYATYEQSSDPRQQVELYKAKIGNMRTMKAKFPALAFFYANEITKLQAKLRAAQAQVGVAAEKDQATRDWRKLGYTASGVGIVIGLGFLGLLLVGGARIARGS